MSNSNNQIKLVLFSPLGETWEMKGGDYWFKREWPGRCGGYEQLRGKHGQIKSSDFQLQILEEILLIII